MLLFARFQYTAANCNTPVADAKSPAFLRDFLCSYSAAVGCRAVLGNDLAGGRCHFGRYGGRFCKEVALQRIRAYAGQPPTFDTVLELEMFFRQVYQPYGWLSDAQWRRLTDTSTRRLPDGRVTPHYDPAMVQQFTHHTNDYLIWDHYDALDIPVLCLRGAESDLVLRETTAEMLTRGPGARGLAQVVEVPGCGHAPALNVPEHFALVDGFLAKAG
mgnify:CR=1 FL=1